MVTFRRDDADSKRKVRTHADGKKMIDPWITSWFMAAPINSYFITRLRDATATFWANYVLHYEDKNAHDLRKDTSLSEKTHKPYM